MDNTVNMTHFENTHWRLKLVYNWPWGDIVVIYSSGDSAQLPYVMMKTFYDSTVEKVGGSDLTGKLAL